LFYGGGGKLLGANALGCLCIALWTSSISSIYFLTLRHFELLRLSKSDELLGGDIHYFAPIKFQGKISTYTKGLALTKLNTSYTRTGNLAKKQLMDEILESDDNLADKEK
jgi:hypothetical protein